MIAHLPTLMLVIGYLFFWLEMYFIPHPEGQTSLSAWGLWTIGVVVSLVLSRRNFGPLWQEGEKWYKSLDFPTKIWLTLAKSLMIFILGVAFFAHLMPPHLIQETDALNYHLTIPRQHLITHSFSHIPWSTADLYLLPVDFALAPFELFTSWPNKFPQFFFILGILGVSMRLIEHLSPKNWMGYFLVVAAIAGSHHVGIQMGTAMFDLVLAYLLLAALDSFLSGFWAIGVIEFTFYFWAKSFIPIQTVVIVILVLGLIAILKYFGIKKIDLPLHWPWEKILSGFLLSSVLIGGPFVAKSLYYAGTPLFPFAPGLVSLNKKIDHNSPAWKSLLLKAKLCRDTKDQYAPGRSLKDFIMHGWLIAVPEGGVNNRYDYPAGLMYLLFLGPFFYFSWASLRQGTVPILSILVICWWITWWIGSHQTRFLLVPMVLMLIVGSASLRPSRVLQAVILLSLTLVAISMYGAHHDDWNKNAHQVLREKDKQLLTINEMSQGQGRIVTIEFPDAAFAKFQVDVRNNKSVFVINDSWEGK